MNKRHIQDHGLNGFHRVRLTVAVLLTALIVASHATAGVVVKGNVYGGGNLADVGGSVEVNIKGGQVGDTQIDAEHGNVYGGGALANTNTDNWDGSVLTSDPYYAVTITTTTDLTGYYTRTGSSAPYTYTAATGSASSGTYYKKRDTKVNLTGGTIKGDAYGGGLGRLGTTGENAVEAVEAKVYGDVTVTLNGTKMVASYESDGETVKAGRVFGCNNINGTPVGHVLVHVIRTVDSNKPTEDDEHNPIAREARTIYDVAAVYGGGNQADYVPADALLAPSAANETRIAQARAEVLIESCENTSIESVYGGGNAAAVPATEVIIQGAYIINNVFGGGNGKGTGNPGANVGYYKLNNTDTSYGTGKAVTKLLGGYINYVYGGSNTKGNIRGGTSVMTKDDDSSLTGDCELNVGQIYGAGSQADMDGDANIILECMPNDYVDAVYGGAKNASINGNVSLTVTSGRFGQVFGGNNMSGSINGHITVYVREEGCKDLEIGELFGGGNQAPYSKYGYTKTNNVWVANDETDANLKVHFDANELYPYSIRVFVESCTSIGSIYGGGLGTTATVTGDTYINVNMLYGSVDGQEPKTSVGHIGQVFGGGKQALLKGNAIIDIGTETANERTGVIIQPDNYVNPDASDYASNNTIAISPTESGVYGGGRDADVEGNTTLNIGRKDLTDGTNITGNIYGGGLGETTHVTGDVTVNIGKREAQTANNVTTYTYEGYANITGDVYGGSAKGKVNSKLVNNVETASTYTDPSDNTKTLYRSTNVNLYGGTITGDVYGGGLGDADHAADVYGPITVNVYEGTANNVFGCNNANGTPKSTVDVNINGGTVSQSVYGGGNQAIMDGSPVVNVTGGTIGTENQGGAIYGNVYGGGLGSDGTGNQTDLNKVKAGLVKGDTEINVSGGTILHNIYGGGAYGSVGTYTYDDNTGVIANYTSGGKAKIYITGGTIGTSGKENGMVFGSSRGDVGAPDAIHDKLAWVYDTEVKIGTQDDETDGPAIKGSVYGGGENGHNYHNADVYIYSGTIGINNDETVTYYDNPDDEDEVTYTGKDYNYSYRGNVYGAGCGTDKYWIDADNDNTVDDGEEYFNPLAGIVLGDANITMTGGTVVHNVYGAGAMGSVGTMTTDNNGKVTITSGGTTTITISGGTVGVDGTNNGNVFGAARGDVNTTQTGVALVKTTDVTIGTTTTTVVWGSVYGGGEIGDVQGNAAVAVEGGSIKKNVFGGGKGDGTLYTCAKAMVGINDEGKDVSDPSADAYKDKGTKVTISNGTIGTLNNDGTLVENTGNVYGGGEIGRVEWNTQVEIGIGTGDGPFAPIIEGSVFGAGAGLETHGYSALVRGNSTVTVGGGAKIRKNVYGGGEKATVGRYWVKNINNIVNGVVIEAAEPVPDDLPDGMPYKQQSGGICHVTIQDNAEIGYNGAGDEAGHVFGAGQGVNPHFDDDPKPQKKISTSIDLVDFEAAGDKTAEEMYLEFLETLALSSYTHVTIDGSAKVKGNVYGGSESGFVQDDTDVQIQGGTIGTSGSSTYGNIYGGGKGLLTFAEAGKVKGNTEIAVSGGTIINGSVYGGGENGIVKKSTVVNVGVVDDAETTTVDETAPFTGTIGKDVYGGGKAADVCQNVTVNVNSGNVTNDVYGGGALANTNTDNWDATANNGAGGWATNKNDETNGTTYKTVVKLNGGTIGNAYGGGLGQLGTGIHYTQEECDEHNISTNIQGWIAENTVLTDNQAKLVNAALGLSGDNAYDAENSEKNTISAAHAAAYNATLDGYITTASWKVHPSVGAGAIKAIVYGDVTVTVNEEIDATNHTYGTAKITIASEEQTYQKTVRNSNNEEETVSVKGTVYTKGRVFGCNNINGTPKGNVSVSVWQTIPQEGITQQGIIHTYTEDDGKYEIQGVYGGGNLANYEPASGKQTTVDIHGCERTSIQYVFGGGNAASVPETHVNIYGDFEIEAVFGGGNGNEPIYSEGHWVQNPGAEIMGNTNVRLMAGLMHQAFGGSFERGIVHGTTNLQKNGEGGEDCVLKITDIFGGGKDADVQQVNIILSECNLGSIEGVDVNDKTQQIENVYAGSYNARIFGNVNMTVRSGKYKNVFGGNYSGGFINGTITINVEETENCKPIKIGNLYGGGNYAPYPGAGANNLNPKITVNVKACTSIGNVYGGSFHADVNGDTEVNINMIKGWWAGKTYTPTDNNAESEYIPDDIGTIGNVYGGGDMGDVLGNAVVNICNLTEIDLETTPDPDPRNNQVPKQNGKYTVLGAKITGNVYGGGNLADVTGITNVTIGAAKGNVISDNNGNPTDYQYTLVNLATTAGSNYKGVTIGGNVYGGGKGEASNFMCDKAMIGTANDGGAEGKGRTFVYIGNGTVGTIENGTLKAETGNVYGGGKIGRVEANTKVTIGYGDGDNNTTHASAPVIRGNVFGAGQGAATHGYSGLVRGISTVTVQGNAEVNGSVYGGGEMATVGRFWIKNVNNIDNEGKLLAGAPEPHTDVPTGMPYALMGGGACTVTIQGYAKIGPDNMVMPTFSGNVFGAGKGILPTGYDYQSGTPKDAHYPKRMVLFNAQTHTTGNQAYWEYVDPANSDINNNIWEYFPDEPSYLRFIQTLALADNTDVTIKGNAFVKGSVYGGSENGRVLDDTDVKIQEHCQIGAGYKNNASLPKYNEADFIDPTAATTTAAVIEAKAAILAECNHWPYGKTVGTGEDAETIYAPFDKYAHDDGYYYNGNTKPENAVYAEGGMPEGSDGHTFYGNVFGGGSGYFPYKDINGQSKWHSEAGAVGGNTIVDITGGHILTNVYGGNEMTNVGNKEDIFTANKGKCTVKFGGTATLGVPRTLTQIADHPVTCYLFGAGKGDQRVFFNKQTNVKEVDVQVSGGIIYGSVFGGGEDGHVMGNVTMNISDDTSETEHTNTKIGTWGTSYVDGNVFGGGRGFAGDAYTAGNVGGNVVVNIQGGTMLGSIYGGGRLGSVGYSLEDVKLADGTTDNPAYGTMQDGDTHGHVTVNISGGTIGNNYEYEYIPANTTIDDTYRTNNYVPFTLFDGKKLMHTKGGNVFAGGMGRREKLGSTDAITAVDWHKLGNVKSTKLIISGTAWIKGNVYGGGEFGAVTGNHQRYSGDTHLVDALGNALTTGSTPSVSALVDAQDDTKKIVAGTEIIITGGTIGTMMQQGVAAKNVTSTTTGSGDNRYTFGSVYGGGYGTEVDVMSTPYETDVEKLAAYVNDSTYIHISGSSTKIRASVYGGGEMAAVKGNTNVNVSNGEIGIGEVRAATTDDGDENYVLFGSWKMGNVYGGGKGSTNAVYSGIVKGNSFVNISGGSIYHNVYGGGAYGSVGTFTPTSAVPSAWTANTGKATVKITGGTIGINGWDNGMVSGSGRGDVSGAAFSDEEYYDKLAWVNNTEVTIGEVTTNTSGSTSSSGPDIRGSVYGGGENGHNYADAVVNVLGGTIGVSKSDATWGSMDISSRGNVYGAGCGTDTYSVTESGKTYKRHNAIAGIVRGNTTVTVSGGQVYNSVYGGGSMGSVGTITNFTDLDNKENNSYLYKHCDESSDGNTLYGFGLSWPYEFTYAEDATSTAENKVYTGLATVTIKGNAEIGEVVTENGKQEVYGGYVFGAPRGKVDVGTDSITEQRYIEAKLANVREAQVFIGTSETSGDYPKIHHSVYGGGEDGHVYEDASVTIYHGTIDRSVFGGGKGEGQFTTTLRKAKGDANSKAYDDLSDQDAYSWTAGRVYGNTTVTMNGGRIGYFVYGGGNLGSVGKGNYAGGADDYSTVGYGELPSAVGDLWTASGSFDPDEPISSQNTPSSMADYFLSSGKATVKILGGIVGTVSGADDFGIPYGSVFGGSRGKAAASCKRSPRYRYVPDFFLGYTNKSIVNIGGYINQESNLVYGDGPTIHGSVYGGGQDGHVRNSTEVKIYKGSIAGQDDDEFGRSGHVFGAGSGIGTYEDGNVNKVNNSSGSVTCTTLVEVNGSDAYIAGNVYGGGALASVGPPKTGGANQTFDEKNTSSGTWKSYSYSQVNIKDGSIGGSVFAASRGPSDSYLATTPHFDTTNGEYDATKYATDIWSNVHVSGGTVAGSVYGGGETGQVKCGVTVNITGGEIAKDVYGGGALAHTNTSNWKQIKPSNVWTWTDETNRTAKYKTIVNLLGGTIHGNAYGGGLGRLAKDAVGIPNTVGYKPAVTAVEAKVFGDVKVNLNGLEEADYVADIHAPLTTGDDARLEPLDPSSKGYQIKDDAKGAIVSKVFGCNNLLGSPQGEVLVHVFGTQNAATTATAIAEPVVGEGQTQPEPTNKVAGRYDVEAVYGGGDLATYKPMGPAAPKNSETSFDNIGEDWENTTLSTNVIIDGCERTSIKQVYGGGNAAPVPATSVLINGTYEIDEVFGGGNGKDNYQLTKVINGEEKVKWYENPGANVGYTNYTHFVEEVEDGSEYDGSSSDKAYRAVNNLDATTKEGRQEHYHYGQGESKVEIYGGTIHVAYGGSNEKGNIRTTVMSKYDTNSDCEVKVDETYGGGKNSVIDGDIDLDLGCVGYMAELFGGSKNADVNSNITLNITNGTYGKVFGGNNTSGAIAGSITVNVQERGCTPIIIGELYLGGYLAPYSIYGYVQDGRGGYTETEPQTYEGVAETIRQRIPITKKMWDETASTYKSQYMVNDLLTLGFLDSDTPTDAEIDAALAQATDEAIEAKVAAASDSEAEALRTAALELAAIKSLLASYPKKDPRINIISATRIDNVFGGGYQALVIGSPHVNVNMEKGKILAEYMVDDDSGTQTGGDTTGGNTPGGDTPGGDNPGGDNPGDEPAPSRVGTNQDSQGNSYEVEGKDTNGNGILPIGTIGNIYGGGNKAAVYGDTYLEIGTGEWVNKDEQREMLGTIKVGNENLTTTFTYNETSKKWTYEKTTTASVAVTGTITPKTGETISDNPENGDTVQGTCAADGITNPTTFTYVKPEGSESGQWTYVKTTTAPEPIDGTPTPVRYTAKIDGDVFGGGNLGDIGETELKVETKTETVDGEEVTTTTTSDDIKQHCSTYVIIGAKKESEILDEDDQPTGQYNYSAVELKPLGADEEFQGIDIAGNVFGGGKGQAKTFRCGDAMVTGGTNIVIGNGTVKRTQRNIGTAQSPKYEWTGTVYGGGKIGRVEENTSVTIGLGDGQATGTFTSAPVIEGNVFGAGQGLNTHGYSALVRGSSTVTVQGNAQVEHSVYGGGEIASVGRYNVGSDGLPVTLVDPTSSTSGHCFVTVKGYAEIGLDNMLMKKEDAQGNPLPPDDMGYVFGAGKGVLPLENVEGKPGRMTPNNNQMAYYDDAVTATGCSTEYSKYLRTLALTTQTDVTVTDHAFVKGAVYGGAENGFVQYDTHVVIDGDCQIGNGHILLKDPTTGNVIVNRGVNRRYTAKEWEAGHLFVDNDPEVVSGDEETALRTAVGSNYSKSLPECASWPYGIDTDNNGKNDKFAPYDKFAQTTTGAEEKYEDGSSTDGGRRQGSDGHTFFGNVFGGGSGYWPYAPGKWYEYAGSVFGNTIVDIKGGHILTSVYGGNELTNVGDYIYSITTDEQGNTKTGIELKSGGDSYVIMTGGTIGVPRTLDEISAHPVTGYLFGAGKGDQRTFFNTATNVGNTFVHVSDDARIYGSVLGGGEDGHVINDVDLSIGSSTLPMSLPSKSVFTGVTTLVGGRNVTVGEGNNAVTTRYPLIGTTGTSYVDGNVFGAGRGFSGEALTAGSVGGNTTLNIDDGTILGSVYGGGRLASVGTFFTNTANPYYGQLQEDEVITPATYYEEDDEIPDGKQVGEEKEPAVMKTYGHITVNISGGVIGNDEENILVKHTKGGNVFGGSMGRLEKLDGETINDLWPKMAVSKTTKVNISGDALIKSNVYGGGEFSMVRGDTYVNIENTTINTPESESPTIKTPTIKRDVYGGGYGSDDFNTQTTVPAGGFDIDEYTFTPMQLAGIVCGDTYVNIKGGKVEKNVYGGGEMATVGLVNFTFAEKHDDHSGTIGGADEKLYGFALSWPYKMGFIPYMANGPVGGTTHVTITGGRLGISGKDFMGPYDKTTGWPLVNGDALDPDDEVNKQAIKAARLDNGDVFGAGKGIAGPRYDYAFCANVKNSIVEINLPTISDPSTYKKDGSSCITGSVYAGGENGHVIEDAELILTNGLIGHSIYGGGKGKDTYHKTGLLKLDGSGGTYEDDICSITSGKVYGNTKVTMEGGYVMRNVYGGGNMASVGKGNYASGTDDYYPAGYGETLKDSKLWESDYDPEQEISETNKPDMAYYFLNSGKTDVKVIGGTVGYIDQKDPSDSMKDGLPYGNVFGGCRGEAAPNITESPRYLYCPLFYSGYVNETNVQIGDENGGPDILGNVYGGGQDGHVRRDTYVEVNNGEIGMAYSETNQTRLKTSDLNSPQWLHRGNVYGAGSGISKYHYDFNYSNGTTFNDTNGNGELDDGEEIETGTYHNNSIKEVDYSTSAGSVTRYTQVDINGGIIHRNVYGGGSLASVGPPTIPPTRTEFAYKPGTTTRDEAFGGGTIGQGWWSQNIVNIKGTVGTPGSAYNELYGGEVYGASRGQSDADYNKHATSVWTLVNILDGAIIMNNVFGGGDSGMVIKDTDVRIGKPAETQSSGDSTGGDGSGSGGSSTGSGTGDGTGGDTGGGSGSGSGSTGGGDTP